MASREYAAALAPQGVCVGDGPSRESSQHPRFRLGIAVDFGGDERRVGGEPPGSVLVSHERGQRGERENCADAERGGQRVVGGQDRNQAGGRAGEHRGDHGDHAGDGAEPLPVLVGEPLYAQPV